MAIALWISPNPLFAHGPVPLDTPVDRLVANLTKYVTAHPDDPEGYYRLGRAHTLALETKTEFVLAFANRDPAEPAEGSWAKRESGRENKPAKATPEQLRTHLTEAVRNLNEAISRRPTAARYRLTLACALEAGEAMINDIDVWPLLSVKDALQSRTAVPDYQIRSCRELFEAAAKEGDVDRLIELLRSEAGPETGLDIVMTLAYERRSQPAYKTVVQELREFDWHEQIEHQFFTAMCYALPQNGRATHKPIWGGMDDWVSYEAGNDFIRVVEGRPARPTDAVRLEVAKQTVKAFEELPKLNAITPIVIDLRGRPLRELESATTTTFDLDGTGRPQRRTWVKPDVGILAWDPEHRGQITSGRQLFGSVSWWLFFDDGYQALDLLDDNRDGELTGPELDGLVAWFDRNENGVCDSGEVVPVQQLGIVALSCRATDREGSSPANLKGMRLGDGRVLPTYDWIASARR